MKAFLLPLILMLFIGCKKDEVKPPVVTQGFSIEVYQNDKLSNGEFVPSPTDVGAIHVWKANGRSLSIKSLTDAIGGYAFDEVSQKSIKAEYLSAGSSKFEAKVDPGQYMAFVVLGEDADSRYTYSTINFSVTAGQIIKLKKVFTTHAPALGYEQWSEPE